jgi:hypothetical protein
MRLRRHVRHVSQIEELLAELGERTAPPSEDELRELARSIASAPRTLGARRRPLRYARWAVGATAAILLAGGFGFGFGLGAWSTESGVAGTSLTGVGFLPAKGWTVVQSGRLGGSDASTAIAANVPLDPDDDLRDAPLATLDSLSSRGVLISTTFTARGDPASDAAFPDRGLPLRMSTAEPVPAGLDPLPLRRSLARYRLLAAVGRYNVDARIYFGAARPAPAQFAVAQAQLNRLVVGTERITLLARPTIHNRNQTITLYGSVDSGVANADVTIEGKRCDRTTWEVVAGAHTNTGGGYSTQYGPFVTTTLRAVWNGNRSAPVTIQDRAWVQLSRRPRTAQGYGFEVSVRAVVQFWKRYVVVQRFEKRLGRWRDVKKVVLTESGAAPGSQFVWSGAEFRVKVPPRTQVRAVFPLSQARPCYLAGYSNQLDT